MESVRRAGWRIIDAIAEHHHVKPENVLIGCWFERDSEGRG